MDLSIVLVSWNTRELLKKCLDTVVDELNLQATIKAEIFVVDNGSTDGSQAMMRAEFPGVQLIENSINVGFGAANNQAMRQAQGRFVLLLNSDTEVHPNALSSLIDVLETRPDLGAVGPLLLNSDGTLQRSCDPEPTLTRELWRLFHLDKLVHYGIYNHNN